MAKKNKKSKKWVFWLVLFLLAGIFYFFLKSDKKPSFISKIENIITSFLPGKDLTQKSLKIDQAVTRTLDKLGIEDKDVIEEYREEKKGFGKTWIQINRKIS
ncbi:hypothetical protein HY745_00115, partial [Candidatus Desantisbacteria bacterium]|nr:hypothetical protein [Candidatus Desantisbacteria bacterium]